MQRKVYKQEQHVILSSKNLETQFANATIDKTAYKLGRSYVHARELADQNYVNNNGKSNFPYPFSFKRNEEEKVEPIFPFTVVRSLENIGTKYYIVA